MHDKDAPTSGTLRPALATRSDAGHDASGFCPSISSNLRGAVWPRDAQHDGAVPPPGVEKQNPESVFSGRQHSSGSGRADGGALRAIGGSEPARRPIFDTPVPPRGYEWWYVDALSDDGQNGITIIAFLGSVFSPYYAWSRRRGGGDPLRHCAINISLHGPRSNRWAFTERGTSAVSRSADWVTIGPSTLAWDGDALRITLDEVAAWFPARICGTVIVWPQAMTGHTVLLDAAGRHRWSPLAPRSRVEVALKSPDARWEGAGYFDTNAGAAPLEQDFAHWHWSCARLTEGAVILYDVTRRDGSRLPIALHIDATGHVTEQDAPRVQRLKPSRWGIARQTLTNGAARVTRTLLDSPFYARSVIATEMMGQHATAMHESLVLDRFEAPWVQAMLPFRIPKKVG